MSITLKWTVLVLAACISGVVATKPLLGAMMERMAVHNGPWRTGASTGSDQANLWERAAVAVAGLYALSPQEAVYYTAFSDSDGRALDGACRYALNGAALPARWWSVTLYGADHYLVGNPGAIYSRHAGNLEFEPDHRYVVQIAPARQSRNWLPSPPAGAFSLTLRLYNPQPAVHEHPDTIPLPAIRREACA